MIIGNGAYPSPLNYHGFPKSICTSVNNVACHGIPDSRPLQEGDILNVDVTVSSFINYAKCFMKCFSTNPKMLKVILKKGYLNSRLSRYILMAIMATARLCFK